jgi:sugar phosphate isomerase/epimerase
MKLSCIPVSFFKELIGGSMTVPEWAQMGKEIGLDAVDLSILFVPDRSRSGVAALRKSIEATGTRVAMVASYPDFTHPDAAQRARELALAQEVVDVAAGLGAEMVRVTAGQAHPETGREDGIRWATEGLRALVDRARKTGVRLVYENHGKPGAWTYTDFSQPPDIFLAIVSATADAGLGLNFDTANATVFSPDPLGLLEQCIERVVSIHAADTAVHGELRPVLLGTGLTPFVPIFQRLVRAGWDNWICIEEASFQGRAGVEKAASFVRQLWDTCGLDARRQDLSSSR